MAVNLTGPMRHGRGRIVNIASVAARADGLVHRIRGVEAGLIHLTRCMAVALAPETSSTVSHRTAWKARVRRPTSGPSRSSAPHPDRS